MSGGPSLPGNAQGTIGFPTGPVELVFDGFDTLNTQPSRTAIEDAQMYICDNFMPFGKNNLRSLPGPGPALYQAPAGLAVVYFWFGNVGTTPICVVFLSDGSVLSVNQDTGAQTVIGGAGTVQNPSPLTVGVSQWGSKYIIIVSKQTNGYFLWDGAILYGAGGIGPDVSIQSDGFGYTSAPTITAIGGEGSGATFSATLENGGLQTIKVTNPGTGYKFYDIVYLAFSGGGGNTTATATATVSGGVVTGISVANGGTGYTSTTSVAVYGGGGYGCVATATVSGGHVTGFTVTSGGESYISAPTVVVTDANNTVAQAGVAIMPFGVSGTAVETYQNQVWVLNGSKGLFTAPSSSSDFSTGDGGGAFQSYDSFLRVGFTGLRQSNGFLYLLADSSLNVISGVSTSGTPPTTTFSNQNVDPQIGSSWPGSVQVFSRSIVFANSFGIHVCYGGAVTKVSAPLDGIYSTVPSFGGFSPSSAVATLYGVHVYMLLLPIIDQVTGQQVNKMLIWDGKRWWTASQGLNLLLIGTQEINSVMTAWGTDGGSIYPLFQTPSATLVKTAQSKLFQKPSYFFLKMANRLFSLVNYNVVSTEAVSIALDNGVSSTQSAIGQNFPSLTWANTAGSAISWAGLTWGRSGLQEAASAVSQPGSLIGMTVQTSAPDVTIVSVTAIVQNYQSLL